MTETQLKFTDRDRREVDHWQRWLDRQPSKRRSVLLERDSAFELHRIPDWFRRTILAAKRHHGWRFPWNATSRWAVFDAFANRFERRWFDHYGTCGDAFVSQPYAELADVEGWASAVSELLDLDVHVDENAPWFYGCVWIAWTPKPGPKLSVLRKRRQSDLKHRICAACRSVVESNNAVYHPYLRVLTHQGQCTETANGLNRDYSRSARGRWRSRADVLADLDRISQDAAMGIATTD